LTSDQADALFDGIDHALCLLPENAPEWDDADFMKVVNAIKDKLYGVVAPHVVAAEEAARLGALAREREAAFACLGHPSPQPQLQPFGAFARPVIWNRFGPPWMPPPGSLAPGLGTVPGFPAVVGAPAIEPPDPPRAVPDQEAGPVSAQAGQAPPAAKAAEPAPDWLSETWW
jgi:hypothetical protein